MGTGKGSHKTILFLRLSQHFCAGGVSFAGITLRLLLHHLEWLCVCRYTGGFFRCHGHLACTVLFVTIEVSILQLFEAAELANHMELP